MTMKLWAWLKCSCSTTWWAGLGAHAAPHCSDHCSPSLSSDCALASKSFKNQPEAQGGAADCESNLRPSKRGHSQSDGRLHHDSSIHLCIRVGELSAGWSGVCVSASQTAVLETAGRRRWEAWGCAAAARASSAGWGWEARAPCGPAEAQAAC